MESPEAKLTKTPEPLDPDIFWARYGAHIEAELHELATGKEEFEDAFNQSWFERAMKGERRFAEQVLGEARRMQIETGIKNSLVLFDVDETIASPKFTDDYKTMITVLRPAATPVFATLTRAGLKVGFLTSRSGEPLKNELSNGTMKPLTPHTTPEHLYTREHEKFPEMRRGFGSREFSEHVFELCGGPNGILDEEFVKKSKIFQEGWWQSGAMARLQLLKKLRAEISGPFLMVDDLQYPHILNGKNGVYGVELDDTSKFFSC